MSDWPLHGHTAICHHLWVNDCYFQYSLVSPSICKWELECVYHSLSEGGAVSLPFLLLRPLQVVFGDWPEEQQEVFKMGRAQAGCCPGS